MHLVLALKCFSASGHPMQSESPLVDEKSNSSLRDDVEIFHFITRLQSETGLENKMLGSINYNLITRVWLLLRTVSHSSQHTMLFFCHWRGIVNFALRFFRLSRRAPRSNSGSAWKWIQLISREAVIAMWLALVVFLLASLPPSCTVFFSSMQICCALFVYLSSRRKRKKNVYK